MTLSCRDATPTHGLLQVQSFVSASTGLAGSVHRKAPVQFLETNLARLRRLKALEASSGLWIREELPGFGAVAKILQLGAGRLGILLEAGAVLDSCRHLHKCQKYPKNAWLQLLEKLVVAGNIR